MGSKKESRLVRKGLPLLLVAVVVLASVPGFFSAYRAAAFETAPKDDYAVYLLAMTGVTGDGPHRQHELFPGTPMAQRPLSVAIALPAYSVLPYYAFSRLEETDERYLRAWAALTLVSWLSMLLTMLAVYAIARHKHKCSQVASYIAALFSLLLFNLLSLASIDPLTILLIAVLIYFIDRPWIAVPLILVSVLVNEKIIVVAAVLCGARVLAWYISQRTLQGFRYWPQLGASGVALIAYVLLRKVVLPRPEGTEYAGQLDPLSWPEKLMESMDLTLSLKGLVANGIPLAVMGILVLIAWVMAPRLRPGSVSFQRSDVLVALALLVTAAFIGMQFTIGRLVVHSFPLYLPMVAVLVDLFVRSHDITEPQPEPNAPRTL